MELETYNLEAKSLRDWNEAWTNSIPDYSPLKSFTSPSAAQSALLGASFANYLDKLKNTYYSPKAVNLHDAFTTFRVDVEHNRYLGYDESLIIGNSLYMLQEGLEVLEELDKREMTPNSTLTVAEVHNLMEEPFEEPKNMNLKMFGIAIAPYMVFFVLSLILWLVKAPSDMYFIPFFFSLFFVGTDIYHGLPYRSRHFQASDPAPMSSKLFNAVLATEMLKECPKTNNIFNVLLTAKSDGEDDEVLLALRGKMFESLDDEGGPWIRKTLKSISAGVNEARAKEAKIEKIRKSLAEERANSLIQRNI